jgi:hypothetical protein
MAHKDASLPSILIESETKKAVKVKAAQEDITISAYLRAALRLWKRGDPVAQRIVEEAKLKK